MRVVVLAPGSTGDVAPSTGLGARLVRAGHRVAVATNERFRPMVTAAGLGFRLLRGDPEPGGVVRPHLGGAAGGARTPRVRASSL